MEFENKAKEAENEGDYLSAIDYYLQALESAEEIKLKKNYKINLANIHNRVATLYTEIGNFDSAIKHYKNTTSFYLESDEFLLKIYRNVGEGYSKIGTCFLVKFNYEVALEHFNRAIGYFEKFIEMEEKEIRHYIRECIIFNRILSIVCLINLNRGMKEILPYLEKTIVLIDNYKIEGFVTDLTLFLKYVIFRNIDEAYKILKNKIEHITDMILLSSSLQTIVMGLILDIAVKYVPSTRIQIQKENSDKNGEIILTRKIYEDMLLYGLSFANRKMSRSNYKEVIALIIGKIDKNNVIISEIIPITSGSNEEVEFKDEDYAKAAKINSEAAKRKEFIIGWYHTHPGIGLFLSATDILNQVGYQSLNESAIAVVFDFTQMTPNNSGFSIFRLDNPTLLSAAYHSLQWRIIDAPKDLYSECIAFFNRFLADLNHIILKNKQMSLAQLAEELNRSEILFEEIIPKLIDLQFLPNTSYNPETKIISKSI
ncbi:MAG: Mov34/MPN/PAD-1 family protein [Promethearchaeota archaeon]